jgi:GT2 family glycosyltransferase
MKKPLVTIIIPNLNGMKLDTLPACLDSLTKPNYPNWELIVVDNNSSDESIEYLKRRFSKLPNCKVVRNPVNIYTQGVNLAAKVAKGKYLALFNNDVAITKGFLKELVGQMEKNQKIAIAQGKLLNYYDHSIIDSVGETIDKYGNPETTGNKKRDTGQYDKIEDILSASGAACVMRNSVFKKLKGYDTSYGIGYEDMDLSLRARMIGCSIKRFPKAVCYHKRAVTDLADFVKIKVKWDFNKNRLTTMLKDYPTGLLIKTFPVIVVVYFGIAFWECFINKNWELGWIRISSIFWVMANSFKILNQRNKVTKNGLLKLDAKDLKLFSSRTLLDAFRDFKK